ncbi:MAG TPA: ABC transporter substrate-binding protein, partial [Castellaniella sp.]|nr:ABC transporter substrate-binding protein [Castellaniella sp.]
HTKKDQVWKSMDAQRQAIELLQDKPDEAAKLIAGYFIAEPTLKTLNQGEIPREEVISKAIQTQTFNAALTPEDVARMQDVADIMQAQGSLKTKDGSTFKVDTIIDLEWQKARKL